MVIVQMQISGQQLSGVTFLILGISMLWVRRRPDRNMLSRALYWSHRKTFHVISVETYFLIAGVTFIGIGLFLLFGTLP